MEFISLFVDYLNVMAQLKIQLIQEDVYIEQETKKKAIVGIITKPSKSTCQL